MKALVNTGEFSRCDAVDGVSSRSELPSEPSADSRRGAPALADEGERSRLIGEITRVLSDPDVPEGARRAGLTLIGWLARRMPGELPHALGVDEARESERQLRAARSKAR